MLPVVGAALAMAEGATGVGSAGGADKATVAASKVLGPWAYGRAGGRASAKCHCKARPGIGSTHCCERASKCPLSRKGCEKGTDELEPAAGGTCQDMEIMRPNEGHLPLKTAEEGTHCDMGRKRSCKGRQCAGAHRERARV